MTGAQMGDHASLRGPGGEATRLALQKLSIQDGPQLVLWTCWLPICLCCEVKKKRQWMKLRLLKKSEMCQRSWHRFPTMKWIEPPVQIFSLIQDTSSVELIFESSFKSSFYYPFIYLFFLFPLCWAYGWTLTILLQSPQHFWPDEGVKPWS